jgi:hypothetical protein
VAESIDDRMRMLRAIAIGVAFLAVTLMPGIVAGISGQGEYHFAQQASEEVDVELVLAVDVSYSMDPDELALQREGYAQAIVSPEFLSALRNGPHGRITIAYFEWSSVNDQRVVIPWRLVDGPESADALAAEIMKAPLRRGSRTSISAAIDFGAKMLAQNQYDGLRRVIDISGDGPNNNGEAVALARDTALRSGIVINGLPIMLKRPSGTVMEIENLDIYFEDCVIGGRGSFVIPVKERSRFQEAIRAKLVLEIADRVEGDRIPVRALAPRVPCTIGEQLWRERWGR